MEGLALHRDAFPVGKIMYAGTHDVVFRRNFDDVKAILQALGAMRGWRSFQDCLDDGFA